MTEIKKTYKNYVDGKYVRSESGKTYTIDLKSESYELPLTSKKIFVMLLRPLKKVLIVGKGLVSTTKHK